MKLAKSLLLGSATAFVAVAGANAADLPSKKAAPVSYVKVCDAYGAGFFNIPGTETCVKIGGRVRADYAFVPQQDIYTAATALPLTYAKVKSNAAPNYNKTEFDPSSSAGKIADAMHASGWEVRGRVDMDARTPTAYGTVQTAFSTRLARTTGVLAATSGADSSSASPTLEAAYIRFAGFTFGVARDNFSFMPSRFYGAGHWSSFANGAKQLSYTAVLGGGFSATIALQDPVDTTLAAYDYTSVASTTNTASVGTRSPADVNRLPQVVGSLNFDQSWGSMMVAGAFRRIESAGTSAEGTYGTAVYPRFKAEANAWALGGGVKVNLPQLASGDAIWLTGAYANGMTEYTSNWGSFKSSAYRRDVGGAQVNPPSYYYYSGTADSGVDAQAKVGTLRSWNLAMVADHFWAPQWRQSFLASYGRVNGDTTSKACGDVAGTKIGATSGQMSTLANGCFAGIRAWNIGTQVAFLPTKDFEIGVEVLYARQTITMPNDGSGIKNTDKIFGGNCLAGDANGVGNGGKNCSTNNVTGRLRVERTF